jgi:putative NADH-flavin reductase
MKIGVIGATGKAGRLIIAEANLRGHEVTAIVRDKTKVKNKDYHILEKDLYDLTAQDLAGFDAVVDAFGTAFDGQSEAGHVTSLEHLITVFESIPKVRLLVVGGAGSLYTDDSKAHQVIENIPKEWQAVPSNMAKAFESLKKSGANWTYFSPAVNFDPFGARILKYTLGTDVAVTNSAKESYISYADYAFAMVDEIEQKKYVKARFTAAGEPPAFKFPPPKPKPYYGIDTDWPVFEGMSQYRDPLNFELEGREYKLVFDDGTSYIVTFNTADTLTWKEIGGDTFTEYYECAKVDELTYFVNWEFARLKPRINITLVLDIEQNLVSKVKTWTKHNPQYPALCENEVIFGAIAVTGLPLPEKRHAFTEDLIGRRILWHYSPDLDIIHVYYNPHRQCVTFPEGRGWGDIPVDVWNAILEANPYDEPAWYVKIKENTYLVSVIEEQMAKRGSGNSLLFLIDTERVHDVGRSFGVAGQLPDLLPENYIFGAYGDFVFSDGVLEAKRNKNLK